MSINLNFWVFLPFGLRQSPG